MNPTDPAPVNPAAGREKWLEEIGPDLPVDPVTLFPYTSGFFGIRANNARARLVAGLKPTLLAALEPQEVVRYAAFATEYVSWEWFLSGYAAAIHHNRSALVLTDRRLFLFQSNAKGKVGDIKRQIRLTELTHAKRAGLFGGYFRLRLADGKSHLFFGLKGYDRKAFRELVPDQGKQPKAKAPSLEHLCPACLRAVPGTAGEVAVCPHPDCRIPFRSARRAARYSFLVPGVGDLYLRHFLFGSVELMGSMALLAVAMHFGMIDFFVGRLGESAAIAACFLLVPRVLDYLLTLAMGRKGIVPLSLSPATVAPGVVPKGPRAPRSLPAFPAWVLALILVACVGAGAATVLSVPFAKGRAATQIAEDFAHRGEFDEALRVFDEAEKSASVDDPDRAQVALALLEAGDVTGANRLIAAIGGRTVEMSLARKLNTRIKANDAAVDAFAKGRTAILAGDDAAGWKLIDQALPILRGVRRPWHPATRDAVAAETAAELLGAPVFDDELDVARRLLDKIGKEAPQDLHDVARARLLALDEKTEEAAAVLKKVDPAKLPPSPRILFLETQLAVSKAPQDELARVAAAAEATPIDRMNLREQGRRALLIALSGKAPAVPKEVLAQAAAIADALDWEEEAELLHAAAEAK